MSLKVNLIIKPYGVTAFFTALETQCCATVARPYVLARPAESSASPALSSSVAWPAAAAAPLPSAPPPPTSRFVVAAASSHLLRQQKQGGRVDVEIALRHGQSFAASMGGLPAPLTQHELAAARRTLTSLVAHKTGGEGEQLRVVLADHLDRIALR